MIYIQRKLMFMLVFEIEGENPVLSLNPPGHEVRSIKVKTFSSGDNRLRAD
jgi:hypothetical protein